MGLSELLVGVSPRIDQEIALHFFVEVFFEKIVLLVVLLA